MKIIALITCIGRTPKRRFSLVNVQYQFLLFNTFATTSILKDMIDTHLCTQIGMIVKKHGANGELVVRLFDKFSIDNMNTEFLFVELDGGLVPFFLEQAREKNKTDVLVQLGLVKEEKEMDPLMNAAVFVKKTTPETDGQSEEFSAYQLIGYTAQAAGRGTVGEIVAIKDIAKNPLFEIDHEGRELLIPIVEEFIVNINDENQTVIFDLPEGLIELE